MEADKLQRAVNADGRQNRLPHDVAYSTGWFLGASSVALTLDRAPLGGAVIETKNLDSWDADASGSFPFLHPTTRGSYILRLTALDASGDPLGTPLEAPSLVLDSQRSFAKIITMGVAPAFPGDSLQGEEQCRRIVAGNATFPCGIGDERQ